MRNAQKNENTLIQELESANQRIAGLESAIEVLLESNEKYSRIFNNFPVALSITRIQDGVIIEINDSYTRLTGFTSQEIVGRKVTDFNLWVKPEDREKLLNILQEKERVRAEELRLRVKSGEVHTVLFSADHINIAGEDCLLAMTIDISRRKKAEETMRFSDAAFKSIQESVVAVDNENNITYWNSFSEQVFGVKASEAVGKNLFNVSEIAPKDYAKLALLKQKLIDRGYNRDEVLFITPRGEVWVDMTTNTIEKDGKRYGTVITAQDITARKQTEKALQESEEKFSKAFNSSANAICITSLPDNRFVEVNESYTRFTGYTREEVIGRTAAELKLWVYDKELQQLQIILTNEGRFNNREFQSRMKSGDIRVGLGSAEVINIGGKPHRIVAISDITELKNAEKALHESEEKFSKAFNSSANAICITTLEENRFIEINEGFTRFTGYTYEEVIGRNASDLKLWVNPEEQKQWIDTLKKDGRVFNQEFSSRMKSGEIRIGLASAEVIIIGGQACRIVAITDISKRKKAEEGTRRAVADLEASGAKLAASNKELEAFSYSVSHDLRSPLRSIDGFSQALLEDYKDKLDTTGQDYLNRLRSASQKMGELIDGLLKLSRLSRSEIRRERTDLSALADDIATRLRETSPERKGEFTIGGGLTAKGDPQMLRALLENLLGNAWKFTGKVPLAKIEFGAVPGSMPQQFFVKDNGAGFDMTYVDKLFGAFQRLHDATDYPGTGIGLATVQRIINRHGGTVRAEGAVGQGATFYFTLG